ncbi:30S ribosomal protein S8 [Candidatus Sumerlaeota bacterium]|nr:30S ribosomal protein S8 [Candidatus Sumerlaeota bacterium]
MPVTDPIADMLTRIRNACAVGSDEVAVPTSRVKVGIAKILREEGFIKHYKIGQVRRKAPKKPGAKREVAPDKGKTGFKRTEIRIFLKYGPRHEKVINGVRRMSSPGRRVYVKSSEIPLVDGGLGITILSTSRGLLTGEQCRKRKLGGEVICSVW